jgi:hypothetical protein
MRVLLNAIHCGCLLLALGAVAQAKDWRGIIPLHSSREDVEKLLGPPHPPPGDGTRAYTMHEGRSIYFLDEGEVYIVYTNGKDPSWVGCSGGVPSGTVLSIKVTPRKEVALRDLHLDEERLKKFDPSEPPGIGYQGYIDVESGIVVRTFKGKVDQVNYVAAKTDRHLCPTYYENPEQSIRVLVHFHSKIDDYGNIPFSDEKARLDNFAVALWEAPEMKGYIIAYGGRRARAGVAKERAERAKNYLVTKRQIDAGRVVTIDGGFREELTVELHLADDEHPPTASPTVDPSEVEVIHEEPKPRQRRARVKP